MRRRQQEPVKNCLCEIVRNRGDARGGRVQKREHKAASGRQMSVLVFFTILVILAVGMSAQPD